ncbi:AraC family transcriptional regulator [Mycobacterium sp. URHB0044]|uniref:AraC family transcriptional regulator n=1 Tax=Mycobacterium sp. URHB0044 TaxID=1380386 RepID=UPI0018CC2660|nr:AraC family transcriptional regulator [Mycobacterium sp. URHB0044]
MHDPLNFVRIVRRSGRCACFTGPVDHLGELRARIARLAATGNGPVCIEGITVLSTEHPTEPLDSINEPVFALVAQGAKRIVVGEHVFDFRAGQYVTVTVDLPVTSQITQASRTEPYLVFGLPLEPAVITALLVEAGPGLARPRTGPAIAVSDADDDLIDAVVRLLRLIDEPRDFAILAPGVRREIHWRLLNGPQASLVREIGLVQSPLAVVTHAIEWLKAHFDEVIRIDELAKDVGVSVSSLNRHFRATTAMSPLQYQKQLRLQRARIELMTSSQDVAAVGHSVGYDSPSQFSREYRRMFGVPPGQDAMRRQNGADIR